MSTTRVSICNAALIMIGERTISSFDEETVTAQRCRELYDQQRKAVLRDHPWSCGKSRVILSPVYTHPAFGYAHAFPLPNDFIRVLDTGLDTYEIEGRHILANADTVYLQYIFDNDNEETWDSLLVEALSLRLAARLCKPITGSDAAGQSAMAEYERLLKKARAVNGHERPSQDMQFEESSYIGSRY